MLPIEERLRIDSEMTHREHAGNLKEELLLSLKERIAVGSISVSPTTIF
jgi:hypothetical protein